MQHHIDASDVMSCATVTSVSDQITTIPNDLPMTVICEQLRFVVNT
jgi:hypothetical protein